jgi:lipid-binding SYLF domain-containing protein
MDTARTETDRRQKLKGQIMNKKIRNMALAIFSVTAALSVCSVRAEENLQAESQQTIANFLNADPSMKTLMDAAAGYAVFPDVGKGGFIVGGARGKGMVYQKGGVAIGQATMTQASIGAQAGGQSFAQIIFFETPAALNAFKSSQFEMGADVSAVAVSQGAAKSAKYREGVAVFTQPKKGLMAQATVGGQRFKFEPLQPTGR